MGTLALLTLLSAVGPLVALALPRDQPDRFVPLGALGYSVAPSHGHAAP